jgi:hypothetical protein
MPSYFIEAEERYRNIENPTIEFLIETRKIRREEAKKDKSRRIEIPFV